MDNHLPSILLTEAKTSYTIFYKLEKEHLEVNVLIKNAWKEDACYVGIIIPDR